MIEIIRENSDKKFYVLGRIDHEYPDIRAMDIVFNEKNVAQRVFSVRELMSILQGA
jgi:hypothetical protein